MRVFIVGSLCIVLGAIVALRAPEQLLQRGYVQTDFSPYLRPWF